jgi:hypothetical protein
MLKAIWPSIAKIPNRLPVSSNITTVGWSIILQDFVACPLIISRNHVLFPLLDNPAPPDDDLTSEDPTFVHYQRDSCSYCMAQHINLVLRQSPGQNQP